MFRFDDGHLTTQLMCHSRELIKDHLHPYQGSIAIFDSLLVCTVLQLLIISDKGTLHPKSFRRT